MSKNNNQDDLYVDNLLRHLPSTEHPIFWSRKDVSLMGVPDILPTVPIPHIWLLLYRRRIGLYLCS